MTEISDGLDTLRSVLSLGEIASLIERTARWVAPQGQGLIDAYDLADSLIHEYRHQKLYLLERHYPMATSVDARVVSPWREDLRPPSGLVHAVFVFIELQRFWEHVFARGPARLHNRALNQIVDTKRNLALAFSTLKACPLSVTGGQLVEVMRRASERELMEG